MHGGAHKDQGFPFNSRVGERWGERLHLVRLFRTSDWHRDSGDLERPSARLDWKRGQLGSYIGDAEEKIKIKSEGGKGSSFSRRCDQVLFGPQTGTEIQVTWRGQAQGLIGRERATR